MKLNANLTLNELASKLSNLSGCYILRHKSPDGDAIGSQFALTLGLRQLGIAAQPLHTDPVPAAYRYMTDEVSDIEVPEGATYIALDSALAGRLGCYENVPITFCIDHHEKNSIGATWKYAVEDASSCCQIVFDLLQKMGAEITPQIGRFLYVGLLTDTNSFRSRSTNAETMAAAAGIAACGIDVGAIARRHVFYKSAKRLAIEGCLMSTLRSECEGRVLSCMLTYDDLQRIGIADNELEGLNTVVEQVEGSELAIVLREKAPGLCRISIRAAEGLNAADICRIYGGGGHANAAGCDIPGEPRAVLAQVECTCIEYLMKREG